MKNIFFIFFLLVSVNIKAGHPCLYITNEEKSELKNKIEKEAWANDLWKKLVKEIEPYADRHQTDPKWLVSRLAMYWKDGEKYTQCYLKNETWDYGTGNAPVPTVRMPGMRIWNDYMNVPLADRTPYNETGDMWGLSKKDPSQKPKLIPYKESGHMIRANNNEILDIASKSAFIYFVSGDEKFARMATDIFNTWVLGTYYMNPILDPGKSSKGYGGYEPGGICGYYDYEQIHDDLAMTIAPAYDFLHDYLDKNPHPHYKVIGKNITDIAGMVFKRFIDIGMVRGGKSGNWNVNGWNMMILPILSLESNDFYVDGKGRDYYLKYYTTTSTQYHDALPEILKVYDPVTGLWPESPGYAMGTIGMLVDVALPIYRAGINTIKDNDVMQKAALSVFPWLDARGNMVVFGDARGGPANFGTFERLLTYYTWVGDNKNAEIVTSAINKGIENGVYNRNQGRWVDLILNTPKLDTTHNGSTYDRMAYSPFHRHIVMKNGDDKRTALMATIYGGTKGHHLTPNGLAMQLYVFGWALAPDASGYESYWSADMTYHQAATGCNTIIPGYTEGEITLNAMEPFVPANSFVSVNEISPYCSFVDVTAGEKRRLLAIIRTSATTGYYVDIFRSDQLDNDYIYHNLGNSLGLATQDGQSLKLNHAAIDNKYTKGYDYFNNPRSVPFNKDFNAMWTLETSPKIHMNMWMMGQEGRALYAVDAPWSNIKDEVSPDAISIAPHPTPTLLVRQTANNGWGSPFVAIFEPFVSDKKSIKSISNLFQDENSTALKVTNNSLSEELNGRTEYICNALDGNIHKPAKGLQFNATFAVACENKSGLQYLYLGYGQLIEKDGYSIRSQRPVSASIMNVNGKWYYSANDEIEVTINKKKYILKAGYDKPVSKL